MRLFKRKKRKYTVITDKVKTPAQIEAERLAKLSQMTSGEM